MMCNQKAKGVFILAFGCGIILARFLPVGVLIFVTGVSSICLGYSCIKR